MIGVRTWIRERWARHRIAVATFAVALAVALVTAVLALVVGDLLPIDGHRRWSIFRLVALVVAVAGLGAAICYRGWVLRRNGTVFYAQVLDEGMPDYHAAARAAAVSRRAGLRATTDRIDVGQRTPDGVVDAVDAVTVTASTLTLLLNTGRDGTGRTIAPNMLWPVALGVGYQLPGGLGYRLLELGSTTAATAGSTGSDAEVDWLPPNGVPEQVVVAIRELARIDLPVTAPQVGAGRVGLLLAFSSAAAKRTRGGLGLGFGWGLI